MPASSRVAIQPNKSLTTQVWLTADEAAAYLKIKPRTLLRWVNDGRIPAYALSGTKRRVWRFRQEDLDSALLARPVLPSPALPVRLEERGIQ
jgi:excisionase family DNA binding protein